MRRQEIHVCSIPTSLLPYRRCCFFHLGARHWAGSCESLVNGCPVMKFLQPLCCSLKVGKREITPRNSTETTSLWSFFFSLSIVLISCLSQTLMHVCMFTCGYHLSLILSSLRPESKETTMLASDLQGVKLPPLPEL